MKSRGKVLERKKEKWNNRVSEKRREEKTMESRKDKQE